MIRKFSFPFALAILPVLLSGCGGGGGGGGGTPPAPPAPPDPPDPPPVFRSIDDLPGSGTLPLNGMALEGNYEIDSMPPRRASATGAESVESASIRIDRSGGRASSLTIRVGADGEPIAFTRFRDLDDEGVTRNVVILESESRTDGSGADRGIAVFHRYQVFGFWLTELGTGSGRFGGGSFGAPTNARGNRGNMATYEGSSSGLYFDESDGIARATVSKMTADVNFNDDRYEIRMTETEAVFSAAGAPTEQDAPDHLNFMVGGSLDNDGSLDPSDVPDGFDTGSLRGSLYGPNGEEIGGVFDFNGASGRYLGAFGGRDPTAE